MYLGRNLSGGTPSFGESLAEVTIGSKVSTIKRELFSGCSKLTSITIPSSVTSIYGSAFEGCSNLKTLTIEDSDTDLYLGNGSSLPSSIEKLYLGRNLSGRTPSFGESLAEFTIGSKVTTIRKKLFSGCSGLTSITIPDSVTSIGSSAFSGCTSLKDVTIGNGIEEIGDYAFSGCASLESFSFGTGLKTIGGEAFSDCTAMTRLVAKTHEPPICGSQALDDINKSECKLYVPVGCEDAYKAADQWKDFFFIEGSIGTGIEKIEKDENMRDAQYYGLDGNKQTHLQKGINIIRMSDGSTRKVLVK